MSNRKLTQVPLRPIVLAVSLFILVTIALYISKWGVGFYDSIEQWGQFGDFFGGLINPAVGFAGVLLLALTLKQNQIAITETSEILKHDQLRQSLIAILQTCKSDLIKEACYNVNPKEYSLSTSTAERVCCTYFHLVTAGKQAECDQLFQYLKDILSSTVFTSLYAASLILDEENDERRRLHLIAVTLSYLPIQVIAILFFYIRMNVINSDTDNPINVGGLKLTQECILHCEMDALFPMFEAEAQRKALSEITS